MSSMKAVKVSRDGGRMVQVPIPKPGKDEVLIKNVAVASNPKDWKMAFMFPDYDRVEGNDVAGYIEAVGEGVTEFKKGDKVAGFSKMMTDDKYGAYAEYTVVPAWTTFPLGPSTSFEEAATLPLAVMTACFGLYQKLNLPETVAPGTTPPIVVINGASSSVGSFAAQLAKISGIKTVGVAGSGGDYAKKCGIDVVVDYRGKSSHELSEAIKEAVKSLGSGSETGECHLVFDCVAENGSVEMLSEVISGKGIITVVLPSKLGSSDESGSLQTPWTAVGAAHESETKDWAAGWYRKLGKWLEEGKFKGNEVKLMPGGLEGVKEGLELLKGGKVHGQKLVYRLAETQGLQSKI